MAAYAPPAAPAQSTRIHGRYALCTFASLTLVLLDWEMEIHTEFADATAHGDFWDVPVPLKYMWTARAKGYFDSASAAYLSQYKGAAGAIAGGTADQVPAQFMAQRNTTGTAIFTANGYVVRTHFSAPMGMAEQEIELRGSGAPGASALP